MPAIRDGRGVLTVHDMGTPPPANPSGPVERRHVAPLVDAGADAPIRRDTAALAESRARGNSLSASRARGAAAGGFVKGATGPKVKAETRAPAARDPGRYPLPRDKAERNAVVLDAIRTTASGREAATLLHVSETRVFQILKEIRRAGAMPEDIATLIQMRRGVPQAKAPGRGPTFADIMADAIPEPVLGSRSAAAVIDRVLDPSIAPCVSCAHAAVCSIKPAVDRWVAHQHAPEGPDPAIHIARRDEITCDHYLAVS